MNGIARFLLSRTTLTASAVLAGSILLLPWFEVGDYLATGWDSGWLLRAAVIAAGVNVVLVRLHGDRRVVAALAWIGLALVAVSVAVPPDFGLGFDGLDVPVTRKAGCWVGLPAAIVAALAATGRVIGPGRAPSSRAANGAPPRPAGAR